MKHGDGAKRKRSSSVGKELRKSSGANKLEDEAQQQEQQQQPRESTRTTRSSNASAAIKLLTEKSLIVFNTVTNQRDAVPPSSPKFLDLSKRIFFPLPLTSDDTIPIPLVRKEGVKSSIESLSKRYSCDQYQVNLLQFYFLDIMVDCLWRAQDEFRFEINEQKIVLDWVAFVLELIADTDLQLDRRAILSMVCEALRVAEERIRSGIKSVPKPREIIDVKKTEGDQLSLNSVELFSSSGSSEEDDVSEDSYIGMITGKMFKLPPKSTGPDFNDECLSSSVSTISDEEEKSKMLEQNESFDNNIVPPPSENISIDNFYKPDMSTPPRFKEIKSDESYSVDISSGDDSKTTLDLKVEERQEDKKWFETLRKQSEMPCTVEESPEQNIANEENYMPDEKEVLKAFYDFNYWQLKKEMMQNEKQGWSPTPPNENEISNDKQNEIKEKKKEIKEELIKYVEIGKEKFEKSNQDIFVNHCVLLAIKQFVFEYLLGSFPFSLVKMAYRYPRFFLTQDINTCWNIPKTFKRDFKKPMPKKPKKPKKEKAKKEKKGKKDKKSKKSEKDSKKSKKKDKESKKSDKSKKSKKELKEEKEKMKLIQKMKKEEEMRLKKEEQRLEEERIRDEENRMYMFPLEDAVQDSFFEGIFEDWKPPKKKGAKDKSEKGSKKGKKSDKSSEKKSKKSKK